MNSSIGGIRAADFLGEIIINANQLVVSLIALTLSWATPIFANNNQQSAVEFFASNNTNEIDLQTAFKRLKGAAQRKLQNDTIDLMQKEHIEQGRFVDLLGAYRMVRDQVITADNSEIFTISAYQKLSVEKIFKLAQQLANILQQESIAVFIPAKQSTVGEVMVNLQSHAYSINEVNNLIAELPAAYNQAYSLHLTKMCAGFDGATVNQIEWLGSKIKLEELKIIFPHEAISVRRGTAYLVYNDGQREQL